MSRSAPPVSQAGAVAAPPADGERARRIGELIFVVLAVALGVFVFVGAFSIRVPGAGTQVGPRVFPFLVSGILTLSAVMVLVDVLRGRLGPQEEGEDIDAHAPTDWVTLGKLVAFVVAHIALIDVIGWALSAALLFGGVAWSLGAKKWWVALLVGLALGLTVQILFGGLLGLSLPLGPLLGWLQPLLDLIGR
ncbi:tripartite tricarboxylate transporter TctB family protein [Rathayibacter sp. VKM Ac-2804]|uniref:tripartite tricarboxylate transporter TctB family protein n=1 Tax=unclassified Rathayibacter TaxID=2609250 RepID=UPI00132EDD54|nr:MULTISPECIES: tripartite tricarboxylate transporter TctB family protein [unclassified Rathayibacter]NRG42616.1 tripartite tricarboxylate transporter TctB family protein [Rathayibacter sp. VKM Ac-2835]QHF24525.1 tripartite tricarboxylate transporter TctB family protein [Rathayibacter sp. VKM Ac-2804]